MIFNYVLILYLGLCNIFVGIILFLVGVVFGIFLMCNYFLLLFVEIIEVVWMDGVWWW